eukprot:scaffold50188_cov25-Prasinocladus_malaysianus.AAC.1
MHTPDYLGAQMPIYLQHAGPRCDPAYALPAGPAWAQLGLGREMGVPAPQTDSNFTPQDRCNARWISGIATSRD